MSRSAFIDSTFVDSTRESRALPRPVQRKIMTVRYNSARDAGVRGVHARVFSAR